MEDFVRNTCAFSKKAIPKGLIFIFILITVTWTTVVSRAASPESVEKEKEAVIAVVNSFFAVLESRSMEDAKKILIPEGISFSHRLKDGKENIQKVSLREVLQSLPLTKKDYKETMTAPEVKIHGAIAVLWAKYEFFVDGKFSHCGVDAFSLIKTPEGWKIAAIVYTVEKTGCRH